MKTISLMLLAVPLSAQPTQLSLSGGSPPPPTNVAATMIGTPGNTPLYYWIIARYPAGSSVPSSAAVAAFTVGAPSLTPSNYVRISWSATSGATGYDVLRTTTPNLTLPCVCAVAANTSATTVNDTGSVAAYPPAGLGVIPPIVSNIVLDNITDASGPFLNVQLLGRATENLRMALLSGIPSEGNCIEYSSGRLRTTTSPCGSGTSIAAGPSGAIIVTANEIDIDTSVVCRTSTSCAPTGSFDLSGSAATKSMKTGTTLPATCAVGEIFFDTDATAGQNIYGCTATNTWTLQGSSSGSLQVFLGPGGCNAPGAGLTSGWALYTGSASNSCGSNGIGSLSFSNSSTPTSYSIFTWPSGWSSGGTISVEFYLSQFAGGSGVYDMTAQLGCVTTGGASNAEPIYNTLAQSGELSIPATNTLQKVTISSVSATGADPGDLCFIKIGRDNTTSGTNFAAAVLVQSVVLSK